MAQDEPVLDRQGGVTTGMAPIIDILLATYNGEAYLAEQIESVLAQDFQDWRLLVRDDGSNDGTTAIISRYVSQYPGKIDLIEDRDTGLGAAGNFARLMEHSRAPYVMLCDQDDVWLPHKVERMLAAIRELEADASTELPLLVFSDLTVVNRDLGTIHPSFWQYMLTDPVAGCLVNRLMGQNVVTGCASICNRRLVELTLPIPPEALMHDWWMALVAASLGELRCLPEATVLYRQHGRNTLGAKDFGALSILRRAALRPVQAVANTRKVLRATQSQAAALHARLGDRMDSRTQSVVAGYAALSETGFWTRRRTAMKFGYLPTGLLRKLIFLAFI